MTYVNLFKNWNDGYDNYKNHIILNISNKLYYHKLTLQEQKPNQSNWLKLMSEYLYGINKIDFLYSGGIDSEFGLLTCKKLNKQVSAVTMKITNNSKVYNEYELDYSTRFCKHNNINQKIIPLDVKFYENGDYIRFIEPYKIKKALIAAHYWLIDQCDNFIIIGGNYFWIKENKLQQKCLSPMSYGSLFYDLYLKENNIQGIGNLLNYGYEGIHLLMSEHLKFYTKNISLGLLKKSIYSSLINENIEVREPKHGFEGYDGTHLYLPFNNIESITWGDYTCDLLNTNITFNSLR